MEKYSSDLLEQAVKQFSMLPGIGRKTATRLVLNMLRRDDEEVENFANAILRARRDIIYCANCHNISDTEICPICANPKRNRRQICVVENIQDVMAIEHTQQFNGLYHVLGGVISPMEGVGPSDLEIESLVERVAKTAKDNSVEQAAGTAEENLVERAAGLASEQSEAEFTVPAASIGGPLEVILALSSTLEGDTTNFYISRKLAPYDVKLTMIARGIQMGSELEYADELTLGRAILERKEFKK